MKKVDILMASYNGEKFIEEQINSIINQTYKYWNLIIRDDGSNDDTLKIIEKFCLKDKRIKLINDAKGNLGVTKNFEELLENSNEKYIMFADQDDIWMENKINIMLKNMENYDVVISDAIVVNDKLEIIESSLMKMVDGREGVIKNIVKNTYYGCCMAFKRKILKDVLPFPKNKEIGHDLWIGLYADKSKKLKFIDDKLIYFRRHGNTQTHILKSKRHIIKKIWGRVVIINYFLKNYKNRN